MISSSCLRESRQVVVHRCIEETQTDNEEENVSFLK